MRVKRASRDWRSFLQSGAPRPLPRQTTHWFVHSLRLSRQAAAHFAQLDIQLRQELRIGITAPIRMKHRFVARGANADLQELGSLSAGQHGGNPIRALDPNPGSVEHFRAGPQTVQNFAEEPFTRIYATALGDVLRPQLAR